MPENGYIFLHFNRTPTSDIIDCTIALLLSMHYSVEISEIPVMHVAEKKQCDPKCHQRSGCSVRGEGKCDSYCVTGYGIDPNTHTCMSECDFDTRFILANLYMTATLTNCLTFATGFIKLMHLAKSTWSFGYDLLCSKLKKLQTV